MLATPMCACGRTNTCDRLLGTLVEGQRVKHDLNVCRQELLGTVTRAEWAEYAIFLAYGQSMSRLRSMYGVRDLFKFFPCSTTTNIPYDVSPLLRNYACLHRSHIS